MNFMMDYSWRKRGRRCEDSITLSLSIGFVIVYYLIVKKYLLLLHFYDNFYDLISKEWSEGVAIIKWLDYSRTSEKMFFSTNWSITVTYGDATVPMYDLLITLFCYLKNNKYKN